MGREIVPSNSKNRPTSRNPLAFGSRQKRFMQIGYHPNLEVRPGTFKHSRIFPGCYEQNLSTKVILKIPSWKRQLEIEEYSKRLGFVGDHILNERRWMKTLNGPGWQDVPEEHNEKSRTFARAPRFVEKQLSSVPGPGTYGKNHIPAGREKNCSYSILPSFEHRSKIIRGLSNFQPYHLPPNLYKPRSSIDELIKKRVSKRGPYDLFSGDRFPEKPVDEKPVARQQKLIYSCCSAVRNEFKGKFPRCGKNSPMTSRIVLKCSPLTGRNPLDPGPSDYDPYPPPTYSSTKCSFGCSFGSGGHGLHLFSIQPPPGRYNPELKKVHVNGCTSVFLSTTKRGGLERSKNSWFE